VGVRKLTHPRNWATFDALKVRNYRWLWIGRLASSTTFQMSSVAQGWLVYQLTGSAFALGWVSSGWAVSALLFSLYGGAVADRVEKRDLLLWVRLGMALNALAIAVLISTGVIQIWHLVVSSLVSGFFYSFMMPAEQAILSEVVDRETLLNAVSLNSVGMGMMGILAAAVAGYLIKVAGVAGAYYVMAGFYLMAFLTMTRIARVGQKARPTTSVWADLREGVRYIRAKSVLLSLLGLTLARVMLGMAYRTFMPKYAQEAMGVDAFGLGILMAAPGFGGLFSSLAIASLGDFRGKGKLLLASGVIMGASLFLFVNVPHLVAVLLLLGIVGAASSACMSLNNTLLQVNSQDELRGRVMSVYMMTWGLMPLGTLPAGVIADQMGVRLVVGAQGVLLALIYLAAAALSPRMRKLE
jgi:MFS family permease